MGFRSGSYANVWDVSRISDSLTKVRISTSRRSRKTGEYEQDFGGYVSFAGTATASKALRLQPRDRIRLGEVDVTNRYDKASGKTYINYLVFSFDMGDEIKTARPADTEVHEDPTEGAVTEPETDEDDLPF